MTLLFQILILFSSLSKAADLEPKSIELYGFIKAGAIAASNAVESFGRPNSVAPTAAGNPALNAHPSRANQSFQVQQSRLGLQAKSAENVLGVFEFDFVDFSKATPTVASVIRLRRAFVDFHGDDNWSYRMGQDWDLFSPLAPHTYNFIGHFFGSGDLGFMRIQAQAFHKRGPWEEALALGFPSNNNQLNQGHAELSVAPTLALRETWTRPPWSLGVSGIIGTLQNQSTGARTSPFGVNLFAKFTGEAFEVVSEAYYGQNLENLSLLALSYSPTLQKLEELGAFATGKIQFGRHGFFGGAGFSRIPQTQNLKPSYSYVGGKPTLNLLTASTGYGINENLTARLGYDYAWSAKLKLFTETAFFSTSHKLDVSDQGRYPHQVQAGLIELGVKLDI